MKNNESIVGYKKIMYEGIDKSKFHHLDEQDLEVILFENLQDKAKDFIVKSDMKTRKYFEQHNTLKFIGKIIWSERNKNEVIISGAHSNIDFRISRHLKDEYDDFISQGKGLGYITIRKHENNFYFIEKFEALKHLREESFKLVSSLRDQYTDAEWKDLLLGSIGYDLRDSEGITKDLLLIRLLPYVEKNYNYIELGGKSTGKTTIAEKFNTGEKINANISASQFLYNNVKKTYGILFSKDVLYLDEVNFTSFNKEIAPSLLQAKAGNKVEVRGPYDARMADTSFVSQGNIENAEYEFMSRNLLEKFSGGFNTDAHFDRECFLIAGWLIPSYSKIALKNDTKGIRMDVFEDYLKVLREKSEYSYLIPNIYTNLVGNSSSGRFSDQINKTISGLLKLIYPNKNFDFEENKKTIDSIIILSCFGKYLIQECANDLGKTEYKNDYLEFSYAEKNKQKITREILEKFYVNAKEYKYFIENDLSLESKVIEYPWTVETYEIEKLKGNISYMKQRVFISEEIKKSFDQIPDGNLKTQLENDYKTILAYKESNKSEEDAKNYIDSFKNLINAFERIINLKKVDLKDSIIIFRPLIDSLLVSVPQPKDFEKVKSFKSTLFLKNIVNSRNGNSYKRFEISDEDNPRKIVENINSIISEVETDIKKRKAKYKESYKDMENECLNRND